MQQQGDIEQAGVLIEESLRLTREMDSHRYTSGALIVWGVIERSRDNYLKALAQFQEALRLAVEIKNESRVVNAILQIASVTATTELLARDHWRGKEPHRGSGRAKDLVSPVERYGTPKEQGWPR